MGARVGAAALVVLLAGCTGKSASPQRPTPSPTPQSPIVIDGNVGEVLTPAPTAHAQLTARAAWIRYSRRAGHPQTTVPSKLRVLLGRLTLPPQFSDRLVWAYGLGPIGCVTTLPHATTPTGVEWTFVDAGTGKMVEETCQRTE